MAYCKKCGNLLEEGDEYCSACGAPVNLTEIFLATWGERFVAYFIDLMLIGVIAGILRPVYFWPFHFPLVFLGINNVLQFLYWSYLEGTQGQSLGKKAIGIKVVDLNGKNIDLGTSMYQAVGKAFLGPLDAIIGWILYPEKQQRLFNNLSQTIVIKE
jgi:uncharacterized RDD family membrane protein YckC